MMEFLLNQIRSLPAWRDLVGKIKAKQMLPGLGLARSARLPVLALLRIELNQPIVMVTDRADHALQLHEELAFWAPDAASLMFSEPNPLFYEDAAWGSATRRERLQTLTSLASFQLPFVKKPLEAPVIITTTRALMTRTLPSHEFFRATRMLKVGQRIPPASLLTNWVNLGYQPVDTVLEPGQFSHRGGLMDVWPQSELFPARLDFFGDEIETLRRFDPASQRTIEKLEALLITPAREYLSGLSDQPAIPELSEFQIPVLHPVTSSLLDYLPKNALLLMDDQSLLKSTAAEIEEQAVKLREESINEGILADDFPVPYFSWSELEDEMLNLSLLELGYSSSEPSASELASHFSPIERFGGRLKPFSEYVADLIQQSEQVVIVSRQSPRLEELLAEVKNSIQTNPAGTLQFFKTSLSAGWKLDMGLQPAVYLFTDSEIFGWERPQSRSRPRPAAETPDAAYADLAPGDWVVHVDYGVGRFVGLVQRTLDGLKREFLCIEYKHGDQVFVPIHQADRLTHYIGAGGSLPNASSLGTQEWLENKRRVREAVQEVARDLLTLYAKRQVVEGFAFSLDTPWQGELESSFPYIETEDQIKALNEIKRDMETTRPMDRLLCGDVGYGKTEVALRAAFKAVMDGCQVALLVPTTVLAQQHFDTFRQRLSAFPVTIEMLSRFRSPREQVQILDGLAQGGVDIVIGTHRLISADVKFKNLGLVIIDEEQRFGVTHKERLKKLRTEVDVLTLTATPIPRTLYMALTGVRDISNLNTPPEERLPVITHVGPYSPRLARQAILRELERGGQIFFVHNRVQTIDAMRMHLEKLVPEARIAIAHGQMQEAQLASVMRTFTAGGIDLLLSTSIIESGLDIPNANTLIVDRADAFGLAQLYQLRGRVGRGAARAYAYFFRHNKLKPTVEGQERLEIIAENTQLGAGYSIAMRDLEMRGAGELLGTQQSGHIALVGFHLYTRMLAAAVRQVRMKARLESPGEKIEEGTKAGVGLAPLNLLQPMGLPINVDLPLNIGIPSSYVADMSLRLRLYRRMADISDQAALEAFKAEFIDRFGPLPEMTNNLFTLVQVKLLAETAGLSSVSMENGQIVLRYPPPPEGSKNKNLPDLEPGVRGGKNSYWCQFGKEKDWQTRLLETLARLKP